MRRTHMIVPVVAAVLFASACASPVPPASVGPGPSLRAPNTVQRTLVMIARGEPTNLGAVDMVSAGPAGREVARLFFATLDFADEHGVAQPFLEEAIPQLNTETWRVHADGTMETTYRLKPNLTWHDGTPLVADDFVFAWDVYRTPSMGVAASPPLNLMGEVLALDTRTVAIRWNQPYPDAGSLKESFQALPRHILEPVFNVGDVDVLANHPYWTQQYVGLGPYMLDHWEPGAYIEAQAFDGHALGRPKIDRVKVVLATDANAAIAAFLSGDAHIVIDNLVRVEDLATILGAGGVVLKSPLSFRIIHIQRRPEMGALRELGDLRVRQAIAHVANKQGINDALYGSQAVVTDTLVSPLSDYYPAIESGVTTYAQDPRLAQQLLEEAGMRKGPDGFYTGFDGAPLSIEVGTTASPVNQTENEIHRDDLKAIGLNSTTMVLTVAQMRDNRAVATFSALFATGRVGSEAGLADFATKNIPRDENRWLGGNRGGWSNSAYDRAWDAYNTLLDRSARVEQIAEMERLVSADVAAIPLLYTPRMIAHVANLRGPTARTSRDAMELVHVEQWEWAS
ncbi:MAG TPA: ABC transporter substrate-binding protein [Chloroflexota bacterium]|nr:ABC transporter substrate-binding protein [Chloroflexota bacterium]